MLKKYLKLALLFLTPVAATVFYQMMTLPERWAFGRSSSSNYGNIMYPDTPYFSSSFDLSLMFLYIAVILHSLYVFTELRSRDTGSFISSLPMKRSAVFTCAFLSGLLIIIPPFAAAGAFTLQRVVQIAPEIRAAFAAFNRPDWAEEIILTSKQSITANVFRTCAFIICLYGILTFTQTLFQKPLAGLCAFFGGLGGIVLCLMTLDKFLIVLGHGGINAWLSPEQQKRFSSFLNLYFLSDDTLSILRYMLLFTVITAVIFTFALLLFQKDERHADFIFTFPLAKKIMLAGVTLCTGCLAVYGLFSMVGMKGLRLGPMILFFIAGATLAYFLTKKVFSVLC